MVFQRIKGCLWTGCLISFLLLLGMTDLSAEDAKPDVSEATLPTDVSDPAEAPNPKLETEVSSPSSSSSQSSESQDIDALDGEDSYTTTDQFLDILGGIKIGGFSGRSSVESFVNRESGGEEVVANGNAHYVGFEIGFESHQATPQHPIYKPFWFYYLTPKYIFQSIKIEDFKEEIPTVTQPNKANIPFVVTDFETGASVDPADPNQYKIRLSTWALVLKGGMGIPMGCVGAKNCFSEIQFFAGAHLLDNMTMSVDYGSDSTTDNQWIGFRATELGSSLVVTLPGISSAFEFGVQGMSYKRLRLPRKLEFRNKSVYNEEKQIFERERIFLNEIQFTVTTVKLAYNYLF